MKPPTSVKRSRDAESYVDDGDTPPPSDPPSKVIRTRSKATNPPAPPVQQIAPHSQADEWNQPYDFEETIMKSSFLATLLVEHEELTVPFKKIMLKRLSLHMRRMREEIPNSVDLIDQWFKSYPQTDSKAELVALQTLRKSWQTLRDEIFKPLAPSTFCKSSNWVEQQNGAAFINCRRPPKCSGLPLNLLHPLFAKFIALIEGPPPNVWDSKFILAERVATILCQAMSQPFNSEAGRLDEFRSIASPLFEALGKKLLGTVDVCQGQADFGVRYPKADLVLVGEGKNEPGGGGGDPYMQAVASYNAWARRVEEATQTSTGCPCFVVCVDGPNVLFGGGFRDNNVSVVEPLSHWCVMMQHSELKRERDLARHLYALLNCLADESKLLAPLPSTTVRCPRIYDAFFPPGTNESVQLKFIEPFNNPWHRQQSVYDLLFRASVEEQTGDGQAIASPVLVKVPSGRYGLEPHLLAAKDEFAPRLLGTAKVEGAPTIYVMELLSRSEGWFHLQKGERPKDITEHQKRRLRDRVKAFLSFLSENNMVHGDLRGCNVMCRFRDEDHADLRVLDWDWAGRSGVARYPTGLNEEAGYKGSPGGLIEVSHDEDILGKTLDDFLL